jgi:hypothetical protein
MVSLQNVVDEVLYTIAEPITSPPPQRRLARPTGAGSSQILRDTIPSTPVDHSRIQTLEAEVADLHTRNGETLERLHAIVDQ